MTYSLSSVSGRRAGFHPEFAARKINIETNESVHKERERKQSPSMTNSLKNVLESISALSIHSLHSLAPVYQISFLHSLSSQP